MYLPADTISDFAPTSIKSFSPVEFQLLMEKNTMKQNIDFSFTEFSEEVENDPWQVVFWGKKVWAVSELSTNDIFNGK